MAPVIIEEEGVRPDGTACVEITTKSPLLDADACPIGILSVQTDITERIRAEEALRAANERNKMILNSAGEGIYVLDPEGRTTFVNPAVCEMLGYEMDELIGKSMHPLIHHSYPDGTPYPREKCPTYAAFTGGEVHHVVDEDLWRKDGSSFPIEYTSTPIRKDGKLAGAVVVLRQPCGIRTILGPLLTAERPVVGPNFLAHRGALVIINPSQNIIPSHTH